MRMFSIFFPDSLTVSQETKIDDTRPPITR